MTKQAIDDSKKQSDEANKLASQIKLLSDALMQSQQIQDYVLVWGLTTAKLCLDVRSQLKLGYQPLGGVSAAAFGIGQNGYVQAMVKYKK